MYSFRGQLWAEDEQLVLILSGIERREGQAREIGARYVRYGRRKCGLYGASGRLDADAAKDAWLSVSVRAVG